jgi:hypothetical protein
MGGARKLTARTDARGMKPPVVSSMLGLRQERLRAAPCQHMDQTLVYTSSMMSPSGANTLSAFVCLHGSRTLLVRAAASAHTASASKVWGSKVLICIRE